MFESRRQQSAHTVYRALLWTLALIVATGVYLDNSPIVIDADQKLAPGLTITREAESNVLVVLDYDAIRASGPGFRTRDFSVAWINLFEQVIGPVSIATPSTLSAKKISAARVIVLTSSVADQVPDTMLERFRQHTLKGDVLVLERPQGQLRETFSANGRAGMRDAQQFTFARDLAEPYNAQLLQMPLSTQLVGSTAPRDNATTHLSLDGAPAIYAIPFGQGTAITVDFDLGEQMIAMQQGRPGEDYRVQRRGPARPAAPDEPPRTSALIMDPAMVNNPIPYADLLARFIVHGVIGQYAPMPTFWAFPGGAQGALIALHEDDSLGDGGGWMLGYETQKAATSTLLATVDAGLSASQAAVLGRMGADLGISYQKPGTAHQRFNRVGIGKFNPIAQPVGLGEQLKTLRKTLPAGAVRTARITGSWWDWQWSHPFEVMAAQDLRVDTSYSPAPGAGYAFGTGFPFLVVNALGEPLSIREMPIVYPAALTQQEGAPELADLIAQSAKGHHQPITWSVPPDIFSDYPDMKRFEQWLSVFDTAAAHAHPVMSVDRFDQFQRARRAGRIDSRVIRDAAVPRGKAQAVAAASGTTSTSDAKKPDAPRTRDGGAVLLRITINARRRDLSLTVPEVVFGKKFVVAQKGVDRRAENLAATELEATPESLVGYPLRRIRLDAGFSSINVYYQ